MIKSFKHKGLKALYERGETKGVHQGHVKKLRRILTVLDTANDAQDMAQPGFKLHLLEPKRDGIWSVWVSGNWRVTFAFEGVDAVMVDYRDYH
ncbi:type II toxin-antitoxin system RelE/ParE family toxin [Salinicola peritrichatus]|uniref:type II toxin-antitoxin system RelE/ParE family toxin n=1 Tax=Salinicola peritrichatus TaxID=1267424 RepID=UPI000DA1DF79|nr:type II toxin-antitoxin system RelE/ParE family toxin [Salinicola peritrichatus]